MAVADHVTGIQHIGLVSKDMEKTIAFYEGLGFKTEWRTDDGYHVAFLRLKDLVIEAYPGEERHADAGSIDHVSLDVDDADAVFEAVKSGGYKLLDENVRFLPFWKKGVRFFTIEGPDGERIEFNEILRQTGEML